MNVKLCLFNGKNKFYFFVRHYFFLKWFISRKISNKLDRVLGILGVNCQFYYCTLWTFNMTYKVILYGFKMLWKSCASCDMNFYITIFTNCFYMRHFVLSSRKIIKTLSTLYPFMHIFALCGIYNKTSLVC